MTQDSSSKNVEATLIHIVCGAQHAHSAPTPRQHVVCMTRSVQPVRQTPARPVYYQNTVNGLDCQNVRGNVTQATYMTRSSCFAHRVLTIVVSVNMKLSAQTPHVGKDAHHGRSQRMRALQGLVGSFQTAARGSVTRVSFVTQSKVFVR